MSAAAGPILCFLVILAVSVLPILALASKAKGFREDEAQFPVRDAGGDVR